MKTTVKASGAVALLFVLAGCSGQVHDGEAAPEGTATIEATCQRLLGPDIEGPLVDSTDIITRAGENPDLSTLEPGEVAGTITRLKSVAVISHPDLKADIEAQIAPLQEMQAALKNAPTTTYIDFTASKNAGLRLIEACTPYL